jgi:hypothetical protein
LLLPVAKNRKVRPDVIHFQGLRYLDLTLAAYVGESVIIRYDPWDMAEIRIFHDNRFLCRASCGVGIHVQGVGKRHFFALFLKTSQGIDFTSL